MSLAEAKAEFIQAWGQFGVEWGINRTMARIHALLLAANEPLDTDTVMAELGTSRGHANTNLRGLVEWGVVKKVHRAGVRRDLYEAEKDMWEVARRVAERRRSRELDPMVRAVSRLAEVRPAAGDDPKETREFAKTMKEITGMGKNAARVLALIGTLDRGGFFGRVLKLVRR